MVELVNDQHLTRGEVRDFRRCLRSGDQHISPEDFPVLLRGYRRQSTRQGHCRLTERRKVITDNFRCLLRDPDGRNQINGGHVDFADCRQGNACFPASWWQVHDTTAGTKKGIVSTFSLCGTYVFVTSK